MDFNFLTGRENKDLIEYNCHNYNFFVHKDALNSFQKLHQVLKEYEIDLAIVSSYRSFEHQLKIWNAKAAGKRILYDKEEKQLDYSKLSPIEIVHAILRWSALPGGSRHHWGTEIDIYDANIKTKEEVNLTPTECESDFKHLYSKIDQYLNEYGFYRPYDKDRGGVSPEPWHLSYQAMSTKIMDHYSIETIIKSIELSDNMLLKDTVLENIEEIYDQYLINISK